MNHAKRLLCGNQEAGVRVLNKIAEAAELCC